MKHILSGLIFTVLFGLVGLGGGFFLIIWGGTSGPSWFEHHGIRNALILIAACLIGGWLFGTWLATP